MLTSPFQASTRIPSLPFNLFRLSEMADQSSQACCLLRLPEELQCWILGKVDTRQTLATLRQTCRRLSRHVAINKPYFEMIHIKGTVDHVERIKDRSFPFIARHVTCVTFWPSCSATQLLTGERFGAVAAYAMMPIKMQPHNLDVGHRHCMHQTQEAREDEIVDAWAAALNGMPNLTKIRTGAYGRDSYVAARIADHKATGTLQLSPSHCSHEECGDHLFRRLVATLSQVRNPPKQLVIQHSSAGSFDREGLFSEHNTVLTTLKSFDFGIESALEDGEPAISDLFEYLQHKCCDHLEDLTISALAGGIGLTFPHEENLITMSSLSYLHLDHCAIHVSYFAQFIALQTSLESLELINTESFEQTGSWRKVWDVIRDHGKCLHLELQSVDCNSGHPLTIELWTAVEDQQNPPTYVVEHENNEEAILIKYLLEEGRWCTVLETSFGERE